MYNKIGPKRLNIEDNYLCENKKHKLYCNTPIYKSIIVNEKMFNVNVTKEVTIRMQTRHAI